MTAELLRDVLAWCSVINIIILGAWFLGFIYYHRELLKFHRRWFKLSIENFDAMHYVCMGIYELLILIFNLVPYLVLRAVI